MEAAVPVILHTGHIHFTEGRTKLEKEDHGTAGSQQQPAALGSTVVGSAVPDVGPAPARSM